MQNVKYYVEPQKEIPIIEADVFIAGAGTAGCMAAVAAAREGAKVVLVEKLPVPTGTMGNGGNTLFSFYNAEDDPEKAIRVVGGLAYEFVERCQAVRGATGLLPTYNSKYPSPYNVVPNKEAIKAVLCEMLLDAGVEVYLQTMLCDVVAQDGQIQYALIENKDGRSAVKAKTYVDCTGDGDIAKYCGVEQLENWQDYDQVCGGPNSLPFSLGGIDYERAMNEAPEVFKLHSESKDENGNVVIRKYRLMHYNDPERCKELVDLNIRHFTTFTSLYDGEAISVNNSKGVMTDASRAKNLSQAEMEMRMRILKMTNAFRNCIPGFEDAHLVSAAIQLGVRTSKITVCDKMLTQDEVGNGARFEDEIGLYGFHDLAEKRPECRIKGAGYYGLPYRMLLPKGYHNLFMAGRCVTFDIEAHMSTRNTVGCMIMGQAAGIAAALCVFNNCHSRELPYPKLREKLLEQGVILAVD